MNLLTATIVAILALAVGAYAAWHTLRRLQFSNPLFYAVAVLEIVLIGVLIGGAVALSQTDRDVSGVLFISYLVTMVVMVPAAVLWGIADKSRWGTGVVVIAMVTIAALAFRVRQIWELGS